MFDKLKLAWEVWRGYREAIGDRSNMTFGERADAETERDRQQLHWDAEAAEETREARAEGEVGVGGDDVGRLPIPALTRSQRRGALRLLEAGALRGVLAVEFGRVGCRRTAVGTLMRRRLEPRAAGSAVLHLSASVSARRCR